MTNVTGVSVPGSFNDFITQFINGAESFASQAYMKLGDLPTIGYGYALIVGGVNGLWQVPNYLAGDFAGAGLTLSDAELRFLGQIANLLNLPSPNAQARAANQQAALNYFDQNAAALFPVTINQQQASQLFVDALNRTTSVIPADIKTSLAGTYELAALDDIAYGVPARANANSARIRTLGQWSMDDVGPCRRG